MPNYFNKTVDETIKELETSKYGLTSDEASIRLSKDGPNKLKEEKKKSVIVKFFEQFEDVMLIILLIAALVSAFVSIRTGESFTDSIIIFFVVVLNAILGVIQESKAEKAIEALKNMSLPYIKAKRNGKIESVKTEELVKGDIVLLEAGDYVPADMRIIESHLLKVEEASLTGESMSIEKNPDVINSDNIAIADTKNMVYTGSNVVYGRGEGVVVSTGMDTELGKIAEAISSQKGEITPLQKKMNELSKVLSIIIIVIAAIMFIIGIITGNNVIDMFMLAISLAVAAIPEGLSAVITITLAIGVQKMAKENAIVRKLSAVEALGATEVICTDKTGTLTQNKMTVRKLFLNNEVIDLTDENNLEKIKLDVKNEKEEISLVAKVFNLCNDTKFGEDNGNKILLGDPTETVLVEFAQSVGYDKEKYDEQYERIDEIPFDSERKMMSTLNLVQNQKIMFVKGATESVLDKCTKIFVDGKVEEITSKDKKLIEQNNINMARDALRVLSLAYRPIKSQDEFKEEDLIFIGLVGMIDAPRKEAKKAVERCFSAGMIPVMITGDNIDTAIAIAKELGILEDEKQAITGLELDNMSDEEFFEKVSDFRVYARVSPENKIRIVKAWKKKGKIVAMTGDGVNDAPALKGADIGVGMGITGTEVSKNVSSMILADDNFATIVVAVKEGRRIYNNIQNAICYLLASNFAEVLIIFIATLINKTLLLPIQILWINLVTDTIPAIALGFEKEEKTIMKQKPRNSQESFFTPFMWCRILIPGIIKTIAVYITYFITVKNYSESLAPTAVFIVLSTMEILFSFICRSDKKSVFKIGLFSNKQMVFCIIGTLLLQALVIFSKPLATLLDLEMLSVKLYIMISVICISTMVIFELVKLILAKIFVDK